MKSVRVRISGELAVKVLTTGYNPGSFRCLSGLPAGSSLVGARVFDDGELDLDFLVPGESVEGEFLTPVFETADKDLVSNE